MDTDLIVTEYTRGVNAYWSGECPDSWSDPAKREVSPYLMGWYHASLWEVSVGDLTYDDGTPMQEDD